MGKTNPKTNHDKEEMKASHFEILKKKNRSYMDKYILEFRNSLLQLNYEQALKELDILLNQLQESNLAVEDLQKSYIQGNLLLDHCEKLLANIEQDILEVTEDTLLD